MKIVHVLEALEGGTALHVRTLAEFQVGAGHDVAVVVPPSRSWGQTDTSLVSRLRELGAPVESIRMHRVPVHPRNVAAAWQLHRFLRRRRPDVVHTHSTVAGAVGRPVARSLGIPTVHTPNGVPFSDVDVTTAARVARVLESVLAPCTTTVIATSQSEGEVLAKAYSPAKIVVIPNGIPIHTSPGPFPERFTVVAVNRFVYQKDPVLGVRVLGALLQRCPEARAVIVGYGELEPDVRRLMDELHAPIEISRDAGGDAIARASVLLLTSRWEGAPYVILEAMHAGRPTVATDVVGSRDAVVPGKTGFLFSRDDPVAGADALVELFASRDLLERTGAAARAELEKDLSIDAMAARVQDVYDAAAPRR